MAAPPTSSSPNREPRDTPARSPEPARYGVVGAGVRALNKHHSESAADVVRRNTSTGSSSAEKQGPGR